MRRGAAIYSAFAFLVSVGGTGCTDEAGGVAAPTPVEPTSGSGSTSQSGAGSGPYGSGSATGSSSPFRGSSGVATTSGLPFGSGATSPSSGAAATFVPDASTPVTESGSSTGGGIPCAVEDLLANRCQSCHGVVPVEPAPNSLVTVADLTGASLVDPTKTNAQESILRMENTVFPMPPAPGAPATVAEIDAVQAWISAGYPASMGCSALDGGASPDDASIASGPSYDGPLVCSSGGTYSGGNGAQMRPGDPCSTCHNFAIAGTVYQTEHETESCNGVNVSGANVVITGSDGTVTTIPVGAAGNFYSTASIVGPFQAKILYQGRERDMLSPQAFGSCNFCHTPVGANSAPGRIMLP
jgi:hypothetical protein